MPRKSQKNLKKVNIRPTIVREEGLLSDHRLEKTTLMRTRAWISSILDDEMGNKISFCVRYQRIHGRGTFSSSVQCVFQLTVIGGYYEARSVDKDPLKALRLCMGQLAHRLSLPNKDELFLPSGVEFAAAG